MEEGTFSMFSRYNTLIHFENIYLLGYYTFAVRKM
jgi:hypothetical protein